MACWRTGVQLPPAPPINAVTPDHSRPPQPNKTKAYSDSLSQPVVASGGRHLPTFGHQNDTILPQADLEGLLLSLKEFGTWECDQYRRSLIPSFGFLTPYVVNFYLQQALSEGHVSANNWLRFLHNKVVIDGLNFCQSSQYLQDRSVHYSMLCSQIPLASSIELVANFGLVYDKQLPNESLHARFSCREWWLKQLRLKAGTVSEEILRVCGAVGKKSSCYSSSITKRAFIAQKEASRQFLESTKITNNLGQTYTLLELSETNVSNPAIRRAELMTRISGFEQLADSYGHQGLFITLSCPSRMHARLAKTGKLNPRFDGTSPKQAQRYLTKTWERARAKFARLGVRPYGFRVVEPHHDGTPHWHLLFFMPPEHTRLVTRVLEHYFLLDSPEEPGAKKYRVKTVAIDKERGSAAGYIAKYIAKNIDGEHIEKDLYGNKAKDSAISITAWASRWRIRQFQQIGGASVSLWRELRRFANQKAEVPNSIEQISEVCDAGDWAEYNVLMGGIDGPAKDRPIKLHYENRYQVHRPTGELVLTHTKYGDPSSPSIKGIVAEGQTIITRIYEWLRVSTTEGGVACGAPPPARSALGVL